MTKRLDIHIRGNSLFFRAEDGWNHDLMHSILSAGELNFSNGEWSLSFTKGIATFHQDRLDDLAGDLYERGRIVSQRERVHALKYYSQVGVFVFGEAADQYGRHGRRY